MTAAGYCQCGCGERTNLARVTNAKRGHIKGQPTRFIVGHGRRAEVADVASRFFPRVERTDSCWNWLGAKNGGGYGRLMLNGVMVGAHRWSYEYHVGPIPDELVIDHLCRNRACVNPTHLEPVTQAENVRRGLSGQKTHCPHGHEYDDANTYVVTRGGGGPERVCRTCKRAAQQAWKQRQREQAGTDRLIAALHATTAADAREHMLEQLGREEW